MPFSIRLQYASKTGRMDNIHDMKNYLTLDMDNEDNIVHKREESGNVYLRTYH